MLHQCKLCSYETIYLSSYKSHIKSVKHKNNIINYDNIKIETVKEIKVEMKTEMKAEIIPFVMKEVKNVTKEV